MDTVLKDQLLRDGVVCLAHVSAVAGLVDVRSDEVQERDELPHIVVESAVAAEQSPRVLRGLGGESSKLSLQGGELTAGQAAAVRVWLKEG